MAVRGWAIRRDLRRIEALKALCAPYYPMLTEAAMRFALSSSEVSSVIPGMLTLAEVDMNIAYSDGVGFPDRTAGNPCSAWLAEEFLPVSDDTGPRG
jgi:aryl-alcohol dehydrogenase-like predicted oxidoreductase